MAPLPLGDLLHRAPHNSHSEQVGSPALLGPEVDELRVRRPDRAAGIQIPIGGEVDGGWEAPVVRGGGPLAGWDPVFQRHDKQVPWTAMIQPTLLDHVGAVPPGVGEEPAVRREGGGTVAPTVVRETNQLPVDGHEPDVWPPVPPFVLPVRVRREGQHP